MVSSLGAGCGPFAFYSGGVCGVSRVVASGRRVFFSNFPQARGFYCRLLWVQAGPAGWAGGPRMCGRAAGWGEIGKSGVAAGARAELYP